MSGRDPGEGRELTPSEGRPLRVCLDLNVFVADLLARRRGREDTAVRLLVDGVARASTPLGPLQLVVSVGMLNRLRSVLRDGLDASPAAVDAYVGAVSAYARSGPSRQSPLLVLGGTGVLPVPDREDAHVLETAVAGRADHDVVIAHPFRAARWVRQGRILLPGRDV